MLQLLREGASVLKVGRDGVSCTYLAAIHPNPEVLCDVLDSGAAIDSGASIDSSAPGKSVPMFPAAGLGHTAQVELLLARGARAEVTNPSYRKTPLMAATAPSGNLPVLKALLKSGANLNHRDHRGQTPLMVAVYWNEPTYVEFLLAAGADRSLRDAKGLTALDQARRVERELTERIRQEPADLHARLQSHRRMLALLSRPTLL